MEMIGDEQNALRSGKGCVDKIFTLKQMCIKMKKEEKIVSLFYGFETGVL